MRARFLLPLTLVAFVTAVGLSFFSTAARARPAAAGGPATTSTTAPTKAPTKAAPSTSTTFRTKTGSSTTFPPPGEVTTTPIPALTTTTAKASPPSTVSLASASRVEGAQLFQNNCASCHGVTAEGSDRAPNLVGLGAATIDFWVATGRMPLAYPTAQPVEKPPRFNRAQTLAIARYVTSLGPGGPGIPTVDLAGASMSDGESLFATNCAGCHAITGVGDALSNGLYAPSLYPATPTVVADAVRTGPGNMPRFGPGTFTPQQVNDLVDYVTRGGIQRPYDKGGDGLGHVGPITEGFVALFLGLGSLLLVLYWIGDRA